jgi:glyoxylase-like metal-dependent hydrolase (beta-lactamase superfamily II)
MLEGKGPLHEWAFVRDPSGRFAGVVDVFGDESVFAIHVPGHTPGSTAFLVRTPTGPELITGDVSHTRWGWEHRVEPGTFTMDGPRSVTSLAQLATLAHDLPGIVVHLGHQHRDHHDTSQTALAGTPFGG